MAFTHVQGISNSATANTVSATLSTTPVPGNLVLVGLSGPASGFPVPVASMLVQDGNGASYTVTPSSGNYAINSSGNADQVWIFYFIVPTSPAASKTITATWGGPSVIMQIYVDEFGVSGGYPIFDTDVFGGINGTNGTTINLPSLTASAGELMYAICATNATVTAPAAGATLGVWTGSGGTNIGLGMAEYVLSASGSATPVNFTQNTSTDWGAMIASFGVNIDTVRVTNQWQINLS